MFNGHVDTNPVTEGWTVDPWGGLVSGGFVYGIGVSNMKAGCASYLEAVRTLLAAGARPDGDVTLTFVVGELQNGVGTRALVEEGYRADWFVNCEPTDLAALTTHAGALAFEVELVGDTRHMSKREEAADALAAATVLAPRINEMALSGAADEDARRTNRAHVGVVRAGLGRELLDTRPPQVADCARLLGSLRYGPGQTPASALADLRQLVTEVCAGLPGITGSVRRTDDVGGAVMDEPFAVRRTARWSPRSMTRTGRCAVSRSRPARSGRTASTAATRRCCSTTPACPAWCADLAGSTTPCRTSGWP